MKSITTLVKRSLLQLFIALTLVSLTGCGSDGSTGPQGATGPQGPSGEQGPSGPTAPTPITETMSANITNAVVADDGALTINFTVADDTGYGFNNLTTSNIRFTVAQLIPAGASGIGESTKWQSYVNRVEAAPTDPEKGSGTEDAIQATSEREGSFTNNGDGSYAYTYAVNLKNTSSPKAVTYNADYTHRVAFQISGGGFPTMNRTYDWQPSTGSTSGITSREMVVEGSCNKCHGELALHGGGRVDTAYCVTCHNPGTKDANSGNILDFKVMIHKIHFGPNLPSVANGGEYAIWGYRDSKHDYSTTPLPMDIRNCTACHDDTIAETPDAANWMNAPSMEACGACHDDIDFSKGKEAENGHFGGAVADNGECALCHGQGRFASTRDKHLGVMENKELVRTKVVAESKAIRIDQTTGDVEVDVMLSIDGVPVTALRDENDVDTDFGAVLGTYRRTDNGALAINWDNGDGYQLTHEEVEFNDCTPDGNGLFTCAASGLLTGITDSDRVTTVGVDFLICMNEKDGEIIRCDTPESDIAKVNQVEVAPVFTYFMGDGSLASDSYNKFGAETSRCINCHRDKHFHHGATELGQCKTCHNATRASSRGRPGDLKHHVHRFHSGLDDDQLIPVEPGDSDHFPNSIADCQACHNPSQIDLPLQQNYRASKANRDAPVFISPTAVVCAACHIDAALGYIDPSKPGYMDDSEISPKHQAILDHMIQNGAVFGSADYNTANKVESCAVCHAVGAEFGVDKVHINREN